jgi:hypothetical protein
MTDAKMGDEQEVPDTKAISILALQPKPIRISVPATSPVLPLTTISTLS